MSIKAHIKACIVRQAMMKNRFAKAKERMEIENNMKIEEELAKESMSENGDGNKN